MSFPLIHHYLNKTKLDSVTKRNLAPLLGFAFDAGTISPAGSGGLSDDTPELQDALDDMSAAGGGEIRLSGIYLIDTDLVIPDNVSIVGWRSQRDPSISGSPIDLLSQRARLIVNPAATITMRNHAGMHGLIVMRQGLVQGEDPTTWTGLAVTVKGCSVTLADCAILGFNQAVQATSSTNGERPARSRFRRLLIDCNNGLELSQAFDIPFVEQCMANNVTSATTSLRSGFGYKFHNTVDWGKCIDTFCYGYAIGFEIEGAHSMMLHNCGADYLSSEASTSIGFWVHGETYWTQIHGCQAAAHGTGLKLETTPAGNSRVAQILGWSSWNCDVAHIHVADGHAIIDGASINQDGAPAGTCDGVVLDAGTTGILSNLTVGDMANGVVDNTNEGDWIKENLRYEQNSGSATGLGTLVSRAEGAAGLHVFRGGAGRHLVVGDAAGATTVNYHELMGAAAGGGPKLGARGSDANIGLRFSAKGTGITGFYNNGDYSSQHFAVGGTDTAAVNYLQAVGRPTTAAPYLAVAGADANIGMRIHTKGTGGFSFFVGGNLKHLDIGDATANVVNNLHLTGAATGSPAKIATAGSDADVDLHLAPKGAGVVRLGTHTANADAPVVGYITIKDSGGTVRKLAVIA